MSVVVRVGGMSCGHCASTVRQAISPLAGVTSVDVDVTAGVVTVDGDGELAAITAAITDAGYTVESVISEGQQPSLPLTNSSGSSCCCG